MCKIHDVSVNDPFGDNAEREEFLRDSQNGQDIWVG